jgi:hypothetical protein
MRKINLGLCQIVIGETADGFLWYERLLLALSDILMGVLQLMFMPFNRWISAENLDLMGWALDRAEDRQLEKLKKG